MQPHAFIVGAVTGDHVIIEIFDYENKSAQDKVQANLLKAAFSVSAGSWGGSHKHVAFSTGEIRDFREQLEKVVKDTNNQARFEPLESYLILKITGDAQGHIEVSGVAFDRPEGLNAIAFNWPLEVSALRPLVEQLKNIEKVFPTV